MIHRWLSYSYRQGLSGGWRLFLCAEKGGAEAKIAELKKTKEDQEAADKVSKQIEALPDDPAKASEADVQAAFDAFMKLTDAQKEKDSFEH